MMDAERHDGALLANSQQLGPDEAGGLAMWVGHRTGLEGDSRFDRKKKSTGGCSILRLAHRRQIEEEQECSSAFLQMIRLYLCKIIDRGHPCICDAMSDLRRRCM